MASKVSAQSLGSPKMNEPRMWMPWRRNVLQALHQLVAGQVEALVDVLQAFLGDRFDADERAQNPRPLHRLEELGVLGRFHRDLRVEHEVAGQLRQRFHQLEPLVSQAFQLVQARRVRPPLGLGDVLVDTG